MAPKMIQHGAQLGPFGGSFGSKKSFKNETQKRLKKRTRLVRVTGWGPLRNTQIPDMRPPEDGSNTPWRAWRHGGGYFRTKILPNFPKKVEKNHFPMLCHDMIYYDIICYDMICYVMIFFWLGRGPARLGPSTGPGRGRALARPGPGPRARPRPGPGPGPGRAAARQKKYHDITYHIITYDIITYHIMT